jgi:transposase-like protein
MPGRKIRDELDARRCLEAVAGAGTSPLEWAREHGVDGRSLNAWRVNLGRRGGGLQLLELVETPGAAPAGVAVRVRCGPFVVEVEEGVGDAHLARVLAVVASC